MALASLLLFAPGYLTGPGFPLDDSWIHAVYGRELARSGTLAYNPGIPAAGETSLLWALAFAIPHVIGRDPWGIAIAMKAIGFALHAATVVLALRLADRLHARPWVAATAAALVALHPDLLAASVSGMEVPLATALALWITLEAIRGPSWRLALACVLAPLGRPEVACLGVLVVALQMVAGRKGQVVSGMVAGGGALASSALVALRNVLVTGRPMPSTFYAKVTTRGLSPWFIQWFGFRYLLEQIALAHILLILPLVLFSAWLLLRPRLGRPADGDVASADAATAAIFLAGTGFFAVSFALVPPLGVTAFYFQRYALPGLPLVLVALPLVIDIALRWAPSARVPLLRGAVALALAVGLLAPMPSRLWRLANDTQNINDVQVAEGRTLAAAMPHQVLWAVDAGAVRYFGQAFVVDLLGLNTPEMLSQERQHFLTQHPPHYFSIVGRWSELDPESRRVMDNVTFSPSTKYTVTKSLPQAVHHLKRCPPQPHAGVLVLFGRPLDFQCGGW